VIRNSEQSENVVDRVLRPLINGVEWWTAFLLIVMLLTVSLGVFFRYVMNASLSWYDEFASYLLVWLTLYGAVVASYRRRHIGFEIVVDKLSTTTKKIVEFIAESCVFGFQIVLFYYGWVLLQRMGDETSVSLVWVKMAWVYSVLPITGGLMLAISAVRLIHILAAKETQKGGSAVWIGSSSE
jgi:TRAP-type C4-dicarboxylate transport system permease small subunit